MSSFKKSILIISSSLIFLFSCGYQPLINLKQPSYSFFNSGKFNTGKALDVLGSCYASKIIESNIEYDISAKSVNILGP